MSSFEECVHRGARIGHHTCELCSQRGRTVYVFACALHGACVLRRWTASNAKMTERSCLTCPDLTLASERPTD